MDKIAVERRLAAILAADVVGYSRLMGADEVGTLKALKAHRGELIDPAIAAHRGRLVKTTGDGILVEFVSVIDAISCAVAMQRGMLTRNASVAEERRIVFRIGINIGDIIIDDNDIFGDGVNVAARLEALCEPGGICISRAANEQVRNKLSLSFADLGEHMVKNITQAVGVFGLAARDIAALPEVPIGPIAKAGAVGIWRRRSLAAMLALVAVGAGLAWWLGWSGAPPEPRDLVGKTEAALALALPGLSESARREIAQGFAALTPHRALAIAPAAGATWRTGGWSSREQAEEKVLEKCQQVRDEPCALLASGDSVLAPGADGRWPIRDMPRVRYSGPFNPERVPAVRSADLLRVEVASYAAAPAPKAMAFHASLRLHVASGTASQRAAEEQALNACNGDPARRVNEGPCFLYAAGNQVVLPLRQSVALSAPPPGAGASIVSPPAAGQLPFAETLADLLAKLAPAHPARSRESQVTSYMEAKQHKALAVFPPGASWWTMGWASPLQAEERALEACQVRNGGPCILLAVDEAMMRPQPDGKWLARAMPRVAYDGLFDPAQIPAASDGLRQRADVVGYRDLGGPKAATLHPWGRLFIVSDPASQRGAEMRALAACNDDPGRKGEAGPCLLYAASDQVVLGKRATAPLAPQ